MKTEYPAASSKVHHPHGGAGARLYNGGSEVAYSNGSVKRKSLPAHPHAPSSGHHHASSNAQMRADGAVSSHHPAGTSSSSSSSSQRGPPPPYPHGRVSLPAGYPMPLDHVAAVTAGGGVVGGGESVTPASVSMTNWGQYPGKGHHHELPPAGHRGASTVHNYPYSHPPG